MPRLNQKTASVIRSSQETLFSPFDASAFVLFRVLFGALLIIQVFFIFTSEFVNENFVQPYYHFPYTLFDVLHFQRLPPALMHALFLIMGLAAMAITFGFFFKTASAIFFSTFLYAFLFEKSLYNDHYYIILLITFLFIFMKTPRSPRPKSFLSSPALSASIPFWQIFILRAQFIIVYFYAAIAKLDYDWLVRAEPLHRILSKKILFGYQLDHLGIAWFFSYGGIILDLLIVILFFWGRYQRVAFACIIIFNLTNHWLFPDIGIFPFLMMGAIALFLKPSEIKEFLKKINIFPKAPTEPHCLEKSPPGKREAAAGQTCVLYFIVIYLLAQFLIPLRHFVLYPGNPSWSFEGARFSWRLKMNTKIVRYRVLVTNPHTGQTQDFTRPGTLTIRQSWLDNMPDMLLQYVHYLRDELKSIGVHQPIITVEAEASFNGRPFQPYIDSRVNLAEVNYPLFSSADWIVPQDIFRYVSKDAFF